MEQLLNFYVQRWSAELEMERKIGIPSGNSMSFQGIDVFGQVLMSLYSGMFGNGGKGSGFDLSDRKSNAAEIKTVCLCQPWRCKSCNGRSPWSSERCIHCSADTLERMDDSRAGISAAAHMKHREHLKTYYMVVVDHVEKEEYRLDAWEIDSDNSYFDSYIRNQHENGGPTVNCLPGSFDFYMSGPTRILTGRFTLGESPKVLSLERCSVIEDVPTSCLRKKELQLVKDHVVNNCIPYDVAKTLITARNKALGKARGDTTRRL